MISVKKSIDRAKNVINRKSSKKTQDLEIGRLLGLIEEQHAYIQGLRKELKIQKSWIQPGHFYSPITNDTNFKRFDDRRTIPGVQLNEPEQLKLLKHFKDYYKDQPFTAIQSKQNRYYFENDQFSYSDALSLYSMLIHTKPKQIIEVGSGFSSALMLDVNNQFLNDKMKLTFIEPYPKRLKSLLLKTDSPTILESFVQDIPLSVFSKLEAGDILFIDSSHVAKSGSDVNWLFHEVLPSLKKGVVVHVHDILYPFEYSKEWISQGRSWNEAYMLRCLLSDSPRYKIIFWANFLHRFHKKAITESLPLGTKNAGGSIWFSIQ